MSSKHVSETLRAYAVLLANGFTHDAAMSVLQLQTIAVGFETTSKPSSKVNSYKTSNNVRPYHKDYSQYRIGAEAMQNAMRYLNEKEDRPITAQELFSELDKAPRGRGFRIASTTLSQYLGKSIYLGKLWNRVSRGLYVAI